MGDDGDRKRKAAAEVRQAPLTPPPIHGTLPPRPVTSSYTFPRPPPSPPLPLPACTALSASSGHMHPVQLPVPLPGLASPSAPTFPLCSTPLNPLPPPQVDATAVAPKKKFLAARAEAAASSSSDVKTEGGAGGGSGGGEGGGGGREASYSVKEMAPSGVIAADGEDIVKFQNAQLYAAHAAAKQDNAKLKEEVVRMEQVQAAAMESVSCVSRHWKALQGELRATLGRLEKTEAAKEGGGVEEVFASIFAMRESLPKKMDEGLQEG